MVNSRPAIRGSKKWRMVAVVGWRQQGVLAKGTEHA